MSTLTNGAVEQISASDQGFAVVVVDDCPALVWFSENGREWSQSSIESGCWAIELAAVAGGWVALTGKREVTVFATVDGLVWTSVESPDNSASPGANFATLPERLLAGRFAPRQSFVASGDTLVFSREGGVWTSTDGGHSWIETSFARGSQVGPTFPMTSTNLGFVGVAIHSGSSQGGMRPIALVSSTDGLNWTEQPTDLLLWDLAGAGDSVIAVELGGGVYTWTPPGSELLAHTGTDPTVLALIGTCFVALGGVLLAWRRRQAIMHPETG
ncbi:MAG: LPXTG cell wall anchor domain-containing protein [Actinomycetia bacterium]|nr:LPXTG cell wall anchor domain-containing protein [Actinomycetes bacterium]